MSAVLLAAALAGTAPGLRYDSPQGFRLTLPAGFRRSFALPSGPTGAMAPAPPGSQQRLDALFLEGTGPDASALAIAVVDAPLELDGAVAERVAGWAVAYVHDQLDSELHLDWVEKVATGFGPAVELAGRVDLDGDERVAQLAFMPLGERQLVFTASLAPGRFPVLGPQIEACLLTLELQILPKRARLSRSEVGALLGVLVGLLVVAARAAWRRWPRAAARDS